MPDFNNEGKRDMPQPHQNLSLNQQDPLSVYRVFASAGLGDFTSTLPHWLATMVSLPSANPVRCSSACCQGVSLGEGYAEHGIWQMQDLPLNEHYSFLVVELSGGRLHSHTGLIRRNPERDWGENLKIKILELFLPCWEEYANSSQGDLLGKRFCKHTQCSLFLNLNHLCSVQ